MSLLPRKGILAIAAVVDVALQTVGRPISAKTLATRHGLPPRRLEPVLQPLVRDGILKGLRGPRGGYALARDCRHVTVSDVLRAVGTVDSLEERPASDLVLNVVPPALAAAEHEFERTLNRIKLEDMVRQAKKLNGAGSGTET
jgi:Rrf2 family protein